MASRPSYEPIANWSREGRARLVREQGDRMRALLEAAFETFVAEEGVALRAFRFHGDDPIPEAVEWCVERFQTADLDPARLHEGSRSWRIFTEVGFWLAQREGKAGYRRALVRRAMGANALDRVALADESPEAVASNHVDVQRMRERIVGGAILLRDTCCAALVGWWLVGSARERRAWFADDEQPDPWDGAFAADPPRNPKERSFHVADALFRYLALFAGLVQHEGGDLSHRACVRTWFDRCSNEPPYEVARVAVRAALGDLPSRQMTTLRHDGVTTLIRRCLALAERPSDDGDPRVRALARSSLRLSLLHRFKIEDAALTDRIHSLKGALE